MVRKSWTLEKPMSQKVSIGLRNMWSAEGGQRVSPHCCNRTSISKQRRLSCSLQVVPSYADWNWKRRWNERYGVRDGSCQ